MYEALGVRGYVFLILVSPAAPIAVTVKVVEWERLGVLKVSLSFTGILCNPGKVTLISLDPSCLVYKIKRSY